MENLEVAPLQLPFTDESKFPDLIDAMMQKRKDLRPATAREALAWIQEECAREQG